MFGGSMFRSMGYPDMMADPFFGLGDMGSQMRHMEDMHSRMMEGMFGFQRSPQMALDYGGRDHRRHHGRDVVRRDVDPYGFPSIGGLFGQMNSLMANMNGMPMAPMGQRMAADPDQHFYSSSTVMSYSNTGNGAPNVYQASTSTRQAPGGVRETRKMVRDSSSGVEKMSVGHHIRDRGHVVQRQRNVRTGDQEEEVDYVNLEEEEAPAFENEWRQNIGRYGNQRAVADARSRPSRPIKPMKEEDHSRSSRTPALKDDGAQAKIDKPKPGRMPQGKKKVTIL